MMKCTTFGRSFFLKDEKEHHFLNSFCLPLWFGFKIMFTKTNDTLQYGKKFFNYNNTLVQSPIDKIFLIISVLGQQSPNHKK
jgi:hypothetical protein